VGKLIELFGRIDGEKFLFVSAAAVCGAILLILEMYDPLGGLIRISDAPLRAAYQVLINR
jgi:hypothetical protein